MSDKKKQAREPINRTRRRLVWLGGGISVAGAPAVHASTLTKTQYAIETKCIESVYGDKHRAAKIGYALLSENLPESSKAQGDVAEPTLETLRHSLSDLLSLTQATSAESVRDAAKAREKQNYAQGDIVKVAGWVMSRTEAELCMLAALI